VVAGGRGGCLVLGGPGCGFRGSRGGGGDYRKLTRLPTRSRVNKKDAPRKGKTVVVSVKEAEKLHFITESKSTLLHT